MKVVSSVAIRPPLNVRSMLFSDRLSAALMLNRRPPEMSCVSPALFVREMTGGVTSSCWPLMLRVVSHAHSTSASAPIPHIAVPRLDIPISVLSAIAPVVVRRLLPGGRDQIVDDVRRDENQQISPVLLLGREADVHRRRPDIRALGVDFHENLAIAGHVRRDAEIDAGLLE